MKKLFSIILLGFFCTIASAQFADWAQFDKFAQSNQEIAESGQRPVAVLMGDSITANWDRMDHGFFVDNNFVGRGISGQTTSHMLVRFREDVINLHPKYVLILAGTNDIALNNGSITPENILGNIVSMCELAKLHKIKPVVCAVLPSTEYHWRKAVGNPADKIIALNAMLEDYARKNHLMFLDYHSLLKDEDNGLKGEYMKSLQDGTPDHTHPSLAAYKLMESLVLERLK